MITQLVKSENKVQEYRPTLTVLNQENLEESSLLTSQRFAKDDPTIPVNYWFQNPVEGLTFFIVFYTQACRWSKCLGCNLPSQSSPCHVKSEDIMKQVDFVFDYILSEQDKAKLKKLIVSNNGSMLDQETFSSNALVYLLTKINRTCPDISMLTLETRPEYVDTEKLELISHTLNQKPGKVTEVEIAIGLEAFDDTIRNNYFRKGTTLALVEKLAEKLAKYQFQLKTYFMLKPVPQITEQEGIEDIKKGIDYLSYLAQKYQLRINLHLNPTYVASGTQLEREFKQGTFVPPTLESVRQAVLHGEGKNISIYIGLNDEGLAVPEGSFIRPGEGKMIEMLEKFNQTQDFSWLKF